MRLSIVTFYVYLLITGALCNEFSGPYQSVLIWYAYRMDILANGADGRTLLKGSTMPATGPDGSFTFDEFLRALQRVSKKTKLWTGTSGVGTEMSPNVVDAAVGIADAANTGKKTDKYHNSVDEKQLFPNIFGPNSADTNYIELFGHIFENMQANRKKVSMDGPYGKTTQAKELNQKSFDTAVDRSREAIQGVRQGRLADLADKQIKAVNKFMSEKGMSSEAVTDDKSAMEGKLKWKEINTAATLAANSGATAELKQAFIAYTAENYGGENEKGRRDAHLAALQFTQTAESRLWNSDFC